MKGKAVGSGEGAWRRVGEVVRRWGRQVKWLMDVVHDVEQSE